MTHDQTRETTMTDMSSSPTGTRVATGTPGALSLRAIRKTYGDDRKVAPAVKDIDLDIHPGEFLTLLGPSGCGKTTTLRMIAGFEIPTSGELRLDGELINQMAPNHRPMAMVFQSYALFPHLSVFDNVAYGLKLKKLPASQIKSEVEAALSSMNLSRMPLAHLTNSPEDSSSGSPSPGRSSCDRRCSSSTSPCPTSTPNCACTCAGRSDGSNAIWASPRSSLPMTRTRR